MSHVKGEAERRKGWQLPSKADDSQWQRAMVCGGKWRMTRGVYASCSSATWSCELAGVPPSNSNGASKTPFLVENGVLCPCPGVWGSVFL